MNQIEQEIAHNIDIEEEILIWRVVAAVYIFIDEKIIVDFWVITTFIERVKHVSNGTSSQRVNGAISEAWGLGLLNLVKETNNNTKHLTGREIKIYSDKKKVINACKSEESWEHVLLCGKLKRSREQWINKTQKYLML